MLLVGCEGVGHALGAFYAAGLHPICASFETGIRYVCVFSVAYTRIRYLPKMSYTRHRHLPKICEDLPFYQQERNLRGEYFEMTRFPEALRGERLL
jgi:hypothetical protein